VKPFFAYGSVAKCLFVTVRIKVDNQGTLILLGLINFPFEVKPLFACFATVSLFRNSTLREDCLLLGF